MKMPRLISVLMLGWVWLQSPAAATARDDYANFFKGLHGLEGEFSQQVVDAKGHIKEQSRGELALSFPRQFYWNEISPHPQQIIADGEHIWIYDADLNQVTVRDQTSNAGDSALLVLMKPDQLANWFTVAEPPTSEDGLEWLALQPKPGHDASFSLVLLGFRHNRIERMDLTDSLGQKTVIRFRAWRRNPHFAASRFRFSPPPTADVIGP